MTPLNPDQRAMVEAAIPLIRLHAKRLARHWKWVGAEALASAGCEAAVQAASRFDSARGVPFDRFIAKRAVGAMRDEIRALTPGISAGVLHAWSVDERDETEELSAAELFDRSVPEPLSPRREQVAFMRHHTTAMLVAHLLHRGIDPEAELAERDHRARALGVLERVLADRSVDERRLMEGFFRDGWTLDQAALEIGVAKRTVQRMHDRIKEDALKALIRDGLLAG